MAKHSKTDLPYQGLARFIRAAQDIPAVAALLEPGRPRSTGQGLQTLDHEALVFYTDGSLRHAGGRVRGKYARKQYKRYRRVVRAVIASQQGTMSTVGYIPVQKEDTHESHEN